MQYLLAILSAIAILIGQFLYGGIFRPVFAYPSYLLIGLAALMVGALLWRPSRKGGPDAGLVGLVFALGLWIILRCLFAEHGIQAMGFLQTALGCLCMYLVFVFGVTESRPRCFFVFLLVMGALLQCGLAGGQFFGAIAGQPQGWLSEQLRLWYDRGDIPTIYNRAHGSYINGNHLAWFLNAAGFLALAQGAFGRFGIVAKILWIYVGAMCLAVSLACLSRGGLLAMGGGLVFLFLLSATAVVIGAPGRRWASFSVLVGAFAIPTGIVLFIVNQNAAVQMRVSALFADVYRSHVWLAALREFQLSPFLGEGPGAFASYARQFRSAFMTHDDYFAHNDWLQLAADFGYPALVLGVLIVVSHLNSGWIGTIRSLRGRVMTMIPQSNSAAIFMGAGASVVAFTIHSFFDFNLQLPANALLAAACMGFLVNQDSRSTAWRSKAVWYGGMAVSVAAGLCLLAALWINRGELDRLNAENLLLRGEPILAARLAAAPSSQAGGYHHLFIEGSAHLQVAESTIDPQAKKEALAAAVRSLRRAKELAPDERSVAIVLCRNYLLQGDVAAAKKMAFEVIRLEPRTADGYELYGSILEFEGATSQARRVYLLGASLNVTEFLSARLKALGTNANEWPSPSERK